MKLNFTAMTALLLSMALLLCACSGIPGAPSAQMAYVVAFSTCRSKKSSVTPDRLAAHRRSAGSARCGDMASNV